MCRFQIKALFEEVKRLRTLEQAHLVQIHRLEEHLEAKRQHIMRLEAKLDKTEINEALQVQTLATESKDTMDNAPATEKESQQHTLTIEDDDDDDDEHDDNDVVDQHNVEAENDHNVEDYEQHKQSVHDAPQCVDDDDDDDDDDDEADNEKNHEDDDCDLDKENNNNDNEQNQKDSGNLPADKENKTNEIKIKKETQ